MIIEFKVENYRSIREEQTLSFVGSNYDQELSGNFVTPELPGMPGVRILRAAALYGANASGKSNVINALRFLADFIANSFVGLKPEEPTGVVPFRLGDDWSGRPTLFEITVLIDGIRYTYGLGINATRVTEEYVIAFPNGKPQTWFEREWNEQTKAYSWSKPTESFQSDDAIQNATRENCAFLSTASQFNHPQLSVVYQFFNSGFHFPNKQANEFSPKHTAEIFLRLEESGSREWIIGILKQADLGIVGLEIEKKKQTEEAPSALVRLFAKLGERWDRLYDIRFTHKGQAGDFSLSFDDQSEGTQRLFSLLGPWLFAMAKEKFVCIDEIESSLHPFLAKELIKLFLSNSGKEHAQLLFSTHNPVLLDQTLLRRDQFWFTEKDDTGATHLYPLTDYTPRKDEALMKGYLAGRYGGIPFIPEGLAKP